MRFIYATRTLPKLEFAAASQREAVPDEAEIFAVCDGAMTIRQHEEQTFSALTEQEQSALDQLIAQSQIAEAAFGNKMNRQRLSLRAWLRQLLNI